MAFSGYRIEIISAIVDHVSAVNNFHHQATARFIGSLILPHPLPTIIRVAAEVAEERRAVHREHLPPEATWTNTRIWGWLAKDLTGWF